MFTSFLLQSRVDKGEGTLRCAIRPTVSANYTINTLFNPPRPLAARRDDRVGQPALTLAQRQHRHIAFSVAA